MAGFLLWSVGSEFFSTNSPQTVYSKALKRVRQDLQVCPWDRRILLVDHCMKVIEVLGEPISGHGELSGRGRRREPL